MAEQHILRIPRSDVEDSFVIINVSNTTNNMLDMRLVGTDDECLYVKRITAVQFQNLRTANFTGSSEDWALVLSNIFLQERVPTSRRNIVEGIEAVASIIDGKSLDINIRKNISGITQRLGSIQLKAKANEEVSIFGWTGVAAQAAITAQEEAERLQTRYEEQEQSIQKLHAQLDELIQAKQDHESSMLEKFRLLLNAKKLKIRDQQRVLAEAKVDDQAEVQSTRAATKTRQPDPSRKSKRKAVDKPAESEVEAEVPGGETDGMDVDLEAAEGEDVAPQETPEPTDASETEDDEEAVPMVSRPTQKQRREAQVSKEDTDMEKAQVEPEEPPPPRDLPFLRGKAGGSKPRQPVVHHGKDEDEDETDDEL